MSRSIVIRGTYYNGVTVSEGTRCILNSDMVLANPILFSESNIGLLIKRFFHQVGNKRLKGKIVVSLNKSGSLSSMHNDLEIRVSSKDLHLYSGMFSNFFNGK